jgi:hypothetical protein
VVALAPIGQPMNIIVADCHRQWSGPPNVASSADSTGP